MLFIGVSRDFSLYNEDQYNTIGAFWDEMSEVYDLESLCGLGYKWERGKISYAIGLKEGVIDGADFSMELPDGGWCTVEGDTDDLKAIYDEIYKEGRLKLEIEEFTLYGKCLIKYLR